MKRKESTIRLENEGNQVANKEIEKKETKIKIQNKKGRKSPNKKWVVKI